MLKYFNIYILIGVLLLFPFVYNSNSDEYEKRYSDSINKQLVERCYEKQGSGQNDSHFGVFNCSYVFLGVPYKNNTLIGNMDIKEKFVINLEGMDCFTYIDYVHALNLSRDYYDFVDNLKLTRYKKGSVSFKTRNHFFYDWSLNVNGIKDVTKDIREEKITTVRKTLNLKKDGSLFLDGIPTRKVKISYIKSKFITPGYLMWLIPGDYIGIYSEEEGLDVSHVGILFVSKDDKYYFRHASSIEGKVVDVDFIEYIKDKPGIIVYRYYDL